MVDFSSVALPNFDKLASSKDSVSVVIGSQSYSAWNAIRIKKSINQIANNFDIQAFDKWRANKERWEIAPGEKVSIFIGTTLTLTGYIDVVRASVTNEDRTITIAGRSLAGDLVDSSAVLEPSSFKQITLGEIVEKFTSQFGIEVDDQVRSSERFPEITINQGETVFELIDRCAKQRGALCISNPDGTISIVNLGEDSVSSLSPSAILNTVTSVSGSVVPKTGLFQSENIIAADATYDSSQIYSEYIVKGQRTASDLSNGEAVTRVVGNAKDGSVDRSARKLVIIAEQAVDKDQAEKRAIWESTNRSAKSTKINVTTQGWFRGDGQLWDVNQTVDLKAPFIGFQEDTLVVSDVTFIKDGKGTTTELALADADSFSLNSIENKTKRELTWEEDVGRTIIKRKRNSIQ